MTSRTFWITTNKLEARPAAKGHGSKGQTRRSHVCFFGLVAKSDVPGTCPTQKLPLFFNSSRWDHEKTNLVYWRSLDQDGILTSSTSR